jgi:hypothetical protein
MLASRVAITIVVTMLASWLPVAGLPSAHASELCKTRRGGLLVRDVCKPRETKLDAPALEALGLRGPAGPVGPVGPPGGGLHVVDALGSDVGVVTRLITGYYYYGQSAQVLREETLPGGTGPEFIQFTVTPDGLSTSEYGCGYYGTYFRTPDCQGEPFVQCEYGTCSSVAGAFLFTTVSFKPDLQGCFARGGSEFERGTFFRQSTVSALSIDQAVAQCTDSGGSLVGPITLCSPGSPFYCGECCRAAQNVGVAPLHTFDASGFGTPPFRLAR